MGLKLTTTIGDPAWEIILEMRKPSTVKRPYGVYDLTIRKPSTPGITTTVRSDELEELVRAFEILT